MELIKKILKKIFGKKNGVKIIFFLNNKYWPNLKIPKTFNEKIQSRKFYGDNELYSNYADKVAFRETIKKIIGDNYLVPIYGIYNILTEEVWNSLPEKFVIKASHGSGSRFIEIITDKKKADFIKIKEKFKKALIINFGEEVDELFYSVKKPKILIEKFIEFDEVEDYKVHCFNKNKKVKCFTQIIRNRDSEGYLVNFYDEEWKKLDFHIGGSLDKKTLKKPEKYPQMIKLSKKILEKFDYARVDFYIVKNQLYIGEVTFCPTSGLQSFKPRIWDRQFGEYWDQRTINNDE